MAPRPSQEKDDFLAALSHELRTPLAPALMTSINVAFRRVEITALREQRLLLIHFWSALAGCFSRSRPKACGHLRGCW